MIITDADLAKDVNRYIGLAESEEITITRDGKVVAKLTSPKHDKVSVAKSLFGIIPSDITYDEAHKERLERL